MVDGLRVVEDGLQAGERVIVHGVQKVFFPGMPVQGRSSRWVTPMPAQAAPAADPEAAFGAATQ
jgi:membrane fusion protein, multidrug efflux system